MSTPLFTVPGMDADDAGQVCDLLQRRLVSLIDLQLTLKHIHWNVVGPTFIGVHEMLDPQVAGVQQMVDDTAERIATPAEPLQLAERLIVLAAATGAVLLLGGLVPELLWALLAGATALALASTADES